MKRVIAYLDRHREEHLQQLAEYLAIPSVSAAPDRARDVVRAAEWTAGQLRRCGLEQVEVRKTAGHPVVLGRSDAQPGRPTALVYGHYDVQPPEPLGLWKSPPFEATIRNGRIYARGAADDKGQVFMHLKVLEAFHQVRGTLPLNYTVLIEGEEEIGSPHLASFIKRHARTLRCNAVVVSDSHMVGLRTPSLTVGLRGLVCFDLSVKTAKQDMHSGGFGGAVANPVQVLAELLAGCKDSATGKIRIPGFYGAVRRLSGGQRRHMDDVPHNDERYAQEVGAVALHGEKGYSTLERVGARPTFEINGISGGYAGDGFKTVLPCEAQAKVSMRLVADQDPDEIEELFRRHIVQRAPSYARVSVERIDGGGEAIRVDPRTPEVRLAARAIGEVFGKDPVLYLEGGSIPIVADFRRLLDVPTVLLGFGLPDDNLHAPNEKLDLRMLKKGMHTLVHFYDAWGRQRRGG